jgi:hypothetical protein
VPTGVVCPRASGRLMAYRPGAGQAQSVGIGAGLLMIAQGCIVIQALYLRR